MKRTLAIVLLVLCLGQFVVGCNAGEVSDAQQQDKINAMNAVTQPGPDGPGRQPRKHQVQP